MRDLTEDELKLAPEWATHYQVSESNYLIWESKDKYQTPIMRAPKKQKSKLTKCIKIPVKEPFDISEHEFSDFSWSINQISVDFIEFYNHETYTDDGDAELFQVSKMDAIAIAKALGVTGEDLL